MFGLGIGRELVHHGKPIRCGDNVAVAPSSFLSKSAYNVNLNIYSIGMFYAAVVPLYTQIFTLLLEFTRLVVPLTNVLEVPSIKLSSQTVVMPAPVEFIGCSGIFTLFFTQGLQFAQCYSRNTPTNISYMRW